MPTSKTPLPSKGTRSRPRAPARAKATDAKGRTKATDAKGRARVTADPMAKITAQRLGRWAGDHILARGERYQAEGRVVDLARDEDGALIAWVRGSTRYATRVALQRDGHLTSDCTCPYWETCKHAVAVVLEHQARLAAGTPAVATGREDPRYRLLEALNREPAVHDDDDEDDDDEDYDDEDYDDEDDDEGHGHRGDGGRVTVRSEPATSLVAWLDTHSKPELVALLGTIMAAHPDVAQTLRDRRSLRRADPSAMLQAACAEIAALDDLEHDRRGWAASAADLPRLKRFLNALIQAGHADAAIDLGPKLVAAGCRLVRQEHEGDSAYELKQLVGLLFKALPRSSRRPAEQLCWAADLELLDDLGLCDEATEALHRRRFPKAAWSTLANHLGQILASFGSPTDPAARTSSGDREQLRKGLFDALHRAGRDAEIRAQLEKDALSCGDYEAVVDFLIATEAWDEAEAWCQRGIAAHREHLLAQSRKAAPVPPRQRGRQPRSRPLAGLPPEGLRSRLRVICEGRGDHRRALALLAESFFYRHDAGSFGALCKTARRRRVGPAVRAWALHFLETGERPQVGPLSSDASAGPDMAGSARPPKRRGRPPKAAPARRAPAKTAPPKPGPDLPWPLPDPGLPTTPPEGLAHGAPSRPFEPPAADVLLEIALDEKRPAEVLRWFDVLEGLRSDDAPRYQVRVAEAVGKTYPERAVALWKALAEAQIARTQPAAYDVAGNHLRRVKALMTSPAQRKEWATYLQALRDANRRKPRCTAVLDRLK